MRDTYEEGQVRQRQIDDLRARLTASEAQFTGLVSERDIARKEAAATAQLLATVTKERDEARAQLATAQSSLRDRFHQWCFGVEVQRWFIKEPNDMTLGEMMLDTIQRWKQERDELQAQFSIAMTGIDALRQRVTELEQALGQFFALVESNDLVRNTEHDADGMKFAMQGMRIVSALAKAQRLLDSTALATTAPDAQSGATP